MSVEVYQLDLDEELLSHLAIPESVDYLREEEVSVDLIEDRFIADIFRWQLDHVFEHRQPATASVMAEEFDVDFDEPLTAIGDLHERLNDRWIRNHMRSRMEKISDAYKDDPSKVIQVLPEVTREVLNVVGPRADRYEAGDFDKSIHKYDEMVLRGPGPGFGFKEINDHFGGMRGVTFVIGAPKTGKTWIGCNSVVQNILDGIPTEVACLELPAHEMDMRIRCLAADVPYWKYVKLRLSQDDRKKLADVSEMLDDLGNYRIVKPPPGSRSFEDMWSKAYDNNAQALVVDQLQYVETRAGKPLGGCDPREFWQPLNTARDLSDDMPIMVMHQFNRSVMNADKMPEMQQAKGAAAIEEVATLALGLWANKDMRRSGILEIGTLASRNFQYENWEISVNLSRGCDFQMIGRVEHDE